MVFIMDSNLHHKSLFKIKENNHEEKQEQRRKLLLKEQKLQRSNMQDLKRFSLHSFLNDIHQKAQGQHNEFSFKEKYNLPYSLQFSEWLKEKPEDLYMWYLVICPKGQRCLVIACNGITEVYNKKGKRMFYFRSKLPGDRALRNEISILDCIYCDKLKKFFVLDAMFLGNCDLYNCEAIFRCYWIRSRFEDNDNYQERGSQNCYDFTVINWIDFEDEEAIQINLMKYPSYDNNIPEVDGFLFYHKNSNYTFGCTPLVGWLFPFMIPEVLGYEVNDIYISEKPKDYRGYITFINNFDEYLAKHKHNRQKQVYKCAKMEEDDEEILENFLNDELLENK